MGITLQNLMTPQTYGQDRRLQRRRLISHRRARSVTLGPCMRLQFEDELTVRYQIQEVLHVERIAGPAEVQHEIDTYARLVPDGSNWKATLFIELPDALERRRALPRLNLAAHRLYVEVPHHARAYAEANEDLDDRHLSRPSAVHFLRFQLPGPMRADLLAGANATLGCAHEQYAFRRLILPPTIEQLRRDLVAPKVRVEA